MSTITTKDGVEIFYKDWGKGQPIVFHHGRPLSSDDWDGQMLFFLQHGYRVIGIDRRGHGRSSQGAEDTTSITTPLTRLRSSTIWICATPCIRRLDRRRRSTPTLRAMARAGSPRLC